MFTTLIESQATRQRHTGGTAVSIACHTMLISSALYLTYGADQAVAKPKEEKIAFVQAQKDPPPKVQVPPPPQAIVAPPPPKGFQILTAPISVPDVIPAIDLSQAPTNEADYSGIGVVGGVADGITGGQPRAVQPDQVYDVVQVERQASADEHNVPPPYPPVLHSANIEGSVVVSFVVDTSGRADMTTFTVLKSTHEFFTTAVKQHLPKMKFIPAEIGGHKVKQLVQQSFVFTLNK
jgi:periplasmic protein TonB